MTEPSTSLKKPTGIPASITWTWKATGEFDAGSLRQGRSYEPCVALNLKGDSRDGWSSPLTLALQLPSGINQPPVTVDPKSIPLNSYLDFPFPTFVAAGPERIKLTATTTQKGNLGSSLIVADGKAKIKRVTNDIPLDITWAWSLSGELDCDKLEKGTTYGLALPLKLHGESYDGWVRPVSLRLQLPDGRAVQPNTLYPGMLPRGSYRDFAFPEFVNPGWTGKKAIFTADAEETGNLLSTLIVADEAAKIKQYYGHVELRVISYIGTAAGETNKDALLVDANLNQSVIPLSDVGSAWKLSGELDTTNLPKGISYTVQLPLQLQGDSPGRWKDPLSLSLHLPRGQSPPPNIICPGTIAVGAYRDFPFPSFVNQGDGKILLSAATDDSDLPSSLVVADGKAKYQQIYGNAPVSVTWEWTAIGVLDTQILSTGTEYAVALPLLLNGTSREGWEKPVVLQLEILPGGVPRTTKVDPKDIPLGAYKQFFFPAFVAQGSGVARLTVRTTQEGNLLSPLLVEEGRALINETDTPIPLSITWTWTARGELDGGELREGSTYDVALPLMLSGDSRDGWGKPLKLELQPPEENSPLPNTVYAASVPLGSYRDFSFPSFVAQGPGKILLSATTTQDSNLFSSLVIGDQKANIREL